MLSVMRGLHALEVTALVAVAVLGWRAWRSAAQARASADLGARLLDLIGLAARWRQPVLPVLVVAADDLRGARARCVRRVAASLDGGLPLAEALRVGAGDCFAPGALATLGATAGAQLDRVAAQLARAHDEARRARYRGQLALGYPALLAVLLVGLHQLCDLPARWFRNEMPMAEAPAGAWSLGFAALAVGLWASVALGRFGPRRGWCDRLRSSALRRVPWCARRARRLAAARALDACAASVAGGASLVAGWRSAAVAAVGDPALQVGARTVAVRLDGGVPLHDALAACPLPDAVLVRLRSFSNAGPEQLAATCRQLAEDCRAQVRHDTERVLRCVQPVAAIAVGMLVLLEFQTLLGWLDAVRLRAMEGMPW